MRLLFHSLLERVGGGGGGGGEGSFELDVQGQEGGTITDVDGQGGNGVLKIRQFSWMSYVDRP